MIGRVGIAIAVGVLVVGAALTVHLAHQPRAAFPLPEASVAVPVDPGGPTDAEMQRSLVADRELEAAPMRRWPGVARREGDVLTIAVDGRDLASFADGGYCDGFDQCARWRFQGVLTLGGRSYPWLTFFHGEGWDTAYLVTPGGGLIGAAGDPSVSPDGRWLVVAFNDPDMDGGVQIFEVRPEGPILVASADVGCEAGRWTGARLSMTCVIDGLPSQRSISAQLVQHDGAWRIRPIAELDAATKKPLARPTGPLAEVEIPAVPVEAAKDDFAYETGKGYRRLASATSRAPTSEASYTP